MGCRETQTGSYMIIPDQGSATCFSRASPHWGTVTRGKKKLMLTFPMSPTSRRMSLKLLKLKSRERSWIWGLKIKRLLPQVILTLIVQYVSSQCISVYVPFAGRFHCFGKGPSANLIASRIKLPLPNRHMVLLDPVAPPTVDQCHFISPVSWWLCLRKDAEHQRGKAQSKTVTNEVFIIWYTFSRHFLRW